MENGGSKKSEPVAIIGTSCRLPGGVNSPSKLWELLKHPVDLSSTIPSSRFNPDAFYHSNAEHSGTANVTKAYLLEDDPLAFDNQFFNISVREAESMDPQQRIILEVVYEAIEASGYSISQLRGSSTGVFLGQMTDDYRDLTLRDMDCHPLYTGTGISRCILANRVSYTFDWKGPSVNVDTACSSSLVALHLAVQSLMQGECETAVVAGVNLVFGPETFSVLSSLRMLSPTGKCHMWDVSADGYARGEGFAAIVIRKLSSAIADGDDIESVIRATGVNQDGHSDGLTVPSSDAQAELIRSTYKKCGLDCFKEEERCQYFEAHGTGTQAGDPKEAQGISMAIFPESHHNDSNGHDVEALGKREARKLWVGSIKTIVGHTEGAAGLVSLIKASLAVQHGLIPPNLHFDRLNPTIEPYYDHLEVPVSLQTWPTLPQGEPRRASVNSFGFGGTNAHAIVESWDSQRTPTEERSSSSCWGPFVVSADSKTALKSTAISLLDALRSQTSIDLSRLAWTLQARRTQFRHRISISATNREQLIDRLDSLIEKIDKFQVSAGPSKSPNISILGVFTGQGAQWVSMGASLFHHATSFRHTFEKLDSALGLMQLGPTWSLVDELLRQDDPIRSSSAEISQPLCTALQIALVDLLRECGVSFSAVVGHSSGEIAAAYAAGVLTASDALAIAYYRGYYSHRCRNKTPGKMMAIGMAPEEARSFCQQPCFLGKIVVAAENSQSSVTLSGDAEAIETAKGMLDEKTIFARILKTDTAYHSHHMSPVREPYSALLKEANIHPARNCFGGACDWYSTVYSSHEGRDMATPTSFNGSYWVENLTRPVLFSQGIIAAIQDRKFDLAIEVGPHPALRGPAVETIREFSGGSLPYLGLLERNKDALDTFSNALGSIWCHVNSSSSPVDFAGFRKACDGPEWMMPRVHKNLPPYQWDHDRSMIKESRKSKLWRTRNTVIHELLGYPVSWAENECHWRNILRLNDVGWLRGHRFQNQVLLPASAYLVMAISAALHIVGNDQPVQMIELQDVIILNGIALEESSPGVELNFSIRIVEEDSAGRTAEFSCRCSNADAASPEFNKEIVTGRVYIQLGLAVEGLLPSRTIPSLSMTDVTTDRFYYWMDKIGLQYSAPFVLDSIKRRLGIATVTTTPTMTDSYTIHPGTLDSIIQGLYAAFSYPGDGRVWTTYLPKSFRRVRFDIDACRQTSNRTDLRLVADCYVTESSAREICGDIDVFHTAGGHAEIQVQGIVLSSLEVPSEANDRNMFWETIWKKDILSIVSSDEGHRRRISCVKKHKLHEACERTARFYLGQLLKDIKQHEAASTGRHFSQFMDWASKRMDTGGQSVLGSGWPADWRKDSLESITTLQGEQSSGQIDLELINHLGPRLSNILRGSELPMQVPGTDGMLDKLFTEGLGIPEIKHHLGTVLDHLVHRYPRMRILELGAGTGDYTSISLQRLGLNLEGYTFTDSSSASFPAAQARFAAQGRFMAFQVLDIERPPVDQGFKAHSYDLVIAVRALNLTGSVTQTLQHCRQLLRPGGYLVVIDVTNTTALRMLFMLSASPILRLGHGDSREQGSIFSEAQWDGFLRDSLFSGIDHSFRDFEQGSAHGFSVMVSQAVDTQILALRDPLNSGSGMIHIEKLLVVGGHTLAISNMARKLKSTLSPFVQQISVISDLGEASRFPLDYGTAVICLCDLEEATFKRMDRSRISGMQALFREAKYIVWATRGSRSEDPYANIAVGIGRSASRELAHLRTRFIDFDRLQPCKRHPDSILLSEMLLQMILLDLPSSDNILWSNETELGVKNGIPLIPRVMPNKILDKHFNSSRRKIIGRFSLNALPPSLGSRDERVVIGNPSLVSSESRVPDGLTIISSSFLKFICLDEDQSFYVCVASSADKKQKMLTISDSNKSITTMGSTYPLPSADETDPNEILSFALLVLISESLLSGSTGTTWIHNADHYVQQILRLVADRRGLPVFLTTDYSAAKSVSTQEAIYIHPRAPERELRTLIPRSIKRFVHMGVTANTSLVDFATHFPWHQLDMHNGIHHCPVDQPFALSLSRSNLSRVLSEHFSQPNIPRDLGHLVHKEVIKADQLHNQPETTSATSTISWTGADSIQVPITPVTNFQLFADQKTYFLVGLTGEVGLSLCEWMIDHGAKYLALASRNPAIPPEMISHLENKGATVRVFSLDISSMESLVSVHQEIVSSMPPIAGVANGALVVRDHPFEGLSFEDLEAVFKPKVVGSQNLDDLFYSTPLDFFILFSSIASVVGKPAQSSYNAANLFMSTLAEKRRSRGLAASALHFGMLLGLGFIHEQAGSTLEARFRQDDLPAIPESEFHHVFAQAIISGYPDSGLSPQVIAGLGTEIDTPWRAIPMFAHCRIKHDEKQTQDQQQDQKDSKQNIQRNLKEATGIEQALSIVKGAIGRRIGLALGMPGENIDEHVGLISLGFDSLISVEIRSWLLKMLEVNIPVLKFLSGLSLLGICHEVLDRLSNSLKPWDKENGDKPKLTNGAINGIHTKSTPPIPEAEHRANGLGGNQIVNPEIDHERLIPTTTLGQTSKHEQTSSEYERVGPMSHSQAQLYFLHDYLHNNAYNIAYYGSFHGQLDVSRLKKALRIVGKRHEGLRSAYLADKDTSQPVQAVLKEPRIIVEQQTANDDSNMQTAINGVKDFKFEIENGIAMKVTITSHSSSLHSILFSHHHIMMDGVGWKAFISDLAMAYSGELHNMAATPRIQQSIEMSKRQLESFAAYNIESDLAFWRETYRTIPEPLPLFPFAKGNTRPSSSDYGINASNVYLSKEVTRLVEQTASNIGVTPFHFYLASFATFLSRCLDISDMAIGIVDANRPEQEDMGTIGHFLNMLPVRIQLHNSEPFNAVARRSRDAAVAAMTHSRAPIDAIIGDLQLPRSTSHHPLFQAAMNYSKSALVESDFGKDGKIKWDGGVPGGHPYDLMLNVIAMPDWTFLNLTAQKNLYKAPDVELLLKWYTRALEALARDYSLPVGNCLILNKIDTKETVDLGRGIDINVPWRGTLTSRVDEIAASFPDSIAVKDDQGQVLTYAQITSRMRQVANRLRSISPPLADESYVAMLLDPVADAVSSILAILRLGFTWVPLDTRNHYLRLRAIVEQCRPQVLVCHNSTKGMAQQIVDNMGSTYVINIDDIDETCNHFNFERSEKGGKYAPTPPSDAVNRRGTHPAMILYTSGSTGVPKGVMLSHDGLVNQIYGTSSFLRLGRETTLQQSPLGFDLMLDQIFLALCNGGTIVIVGKEGRGDPVHIAELMVKHGVTLTHFVPSEYSALLNYGHHILAKTNSWHYAMSGGEPLGQNLRRAFRKLNCERLELINVYGPAEITLACARGVVPYREPNDAYGGDSDCLLPSPNYGIEIIDADMNVLPVGYPGEICISGQGVSIGYLGRPEETESKFVLRSSPKSASGNYRVYRSGDMGRILPDGTLKVLGRMGGDSQVKIHGFRVELDEIANVILKNSNGAIVSAAASWRPSQSSGTLAAFVVFEADFTGDKSGFLNRLRTNLPLPPLMKPRFIIPITRVPATPNGKVDRAAIDQLPIPELGGLSTTGNAAPTFSPWEQSMKEIWEEVFSNQTVSVPGSRSKTLTIRPSSDFFELGGSSILMIKLKSLLRVHFGVTVSMPDLFRSSTLSTMANLLANSTQTAHKNGDSQTTAAFLRAGGAQQVIDWDLEIASLIDGLPQPRFESSISHQRLSNGSKGLNIVLTGATGFIGRHLLWHLVQHPRVIKVHCIAIRPDQSGKPRRLPLQHEKIIEYAGDLSDASLGLSDPDLVSLVEHADTIVHNGADVSLLKTYSSLRRANVISTRRLCEMAIPRRVPVHYISTASVAKVIEHSAENPLLEIAAVPVGSDLLNSVDGYAASKWVSETLLEKVAADNGTPAYIHRLAHVVGEDASELDAMGMLTKYSLLLCALPRIDAKDVTGVWDFITVQDVANDVITMIVDSATGGRGGSKFRQTRREPNLRARFVNHCSDVKVPHEELKKYLEELAGAPLREMDMKEWLEAASEQGLHPLVHEFFTAFSEGQGKLVLPVISRASDGQM
ncbi:hypothetical protein NUW58_g1849 [Xylaria curta]|uniref:Uncharacterized protein n=1 Tax=Xylaria curta TaxID=42375 RepID=A0ACC1PIE4_9PEZI|nr:hypothetical protein NUW58_g1849 [Xylaria curta]